MAATRIGSPQVPSERLRPFYCTVWKRTNIYNLLVIYPALFQKIWLRYARGPIMLASPFPDGYILSLFNATEWVLSHKDSEDLVMIVFIKIF